MKLIPVKDVIGERRKEKVCSGYEAVEKVYFHPLTPPSASSGQAQGGYKKSLIINNSSLGI
jgi:hypothetical protein